ncbi:methyltransferase domain-containing protein [Candidatus Pacearchaeota archaeon]|nr:methyltransferase domain-containing protein [Candidatus Pacearchaeota archaeon]
MEITKEHVRKEFGSRGAQKLYIRLAEQGLWKSEEELIKKYLKKKGAKVLDIGCGTGRTTIPLHKKGYKVMGVDITPEMIENAKKIAKTKKLNINFKVDDATNLSFKDNEFDYALFSNQGWTQIPNSKERLRALREIKRILKKNGIFIFSSHRRVWGSKWFLFWVWMYFRFYILKNLGFKIWENDFGDRLFKRESSSKEEGYDTKQYIHISSEEEIRKQLKEVGFKILFVGSGLSEQSNYKPMFFVVKKD